MTTPPPLTLAEWHYLWHALDYYSDEYGRMGHYEAAKRWPLANRPQDEIKQGKEKESCATR